jgi:asparagine synthase (glutamine-hydrolysing)
VAGPTTLLKGVRHVQPGHHLTITPDDVSEARYWRIPEVAEQTHLSREDAVDRLAHLLDHSVSAQLRSDATVGCQLSGGVDSSLVTLVATAHHRGPLNTFSIVFAEPRFSEERWIEMAVGTAQAVSHRYLFDASAFVDALEPASWHMDGPISHPNALALWWLNRRAREPATVLLTGEGADELFAGYSRFRTAPATAEGFIRATQFHSEARLAKVRPAANLGPAMEKRRAIFAEGEGNHLSNCVRYELRTHLVDLLMRQDRMAMAHGVETRVPFLDLPVITFARALPPEHLVGPTSLGESSTKVVVKELADRRFGAAFAYRPKSAFNLPLAQYFRSRRFVEMMEDRLLPGMASRGLVDVDVVRRWWRRALSAPHTTEAFWVLVALELWAAPFMDERPVRRA